MLVRELRREVEPFQVSFLVFDQSEGPCPLGAGPQALGMVQVHQEVLQIFQVGIQDVVMYSRRALGSPMVGAPQEPVLGCLVLEEINEQ